MFRLEALPPPLNCSALTRLLDVPVEFQSSLIALGVDILVAEVVIECYALLLSHLLQHIHDVLRLLGIHLRVT